LQGTYLMWIDLGEYVSESEIESFVTQECKIAPDLGSWFGGKNSNTFIRVNLATSKENIEEAAKRIIGALNERIN
jgi:cysteine-S-conjugate beta-lyase